MWHEYRRDYNSENIKKFCNCLRSLSFPEVVDSDNMMTAAFHGFYDLFSLLYKLCIPTIMVKVNNHLPKLPCLTIGIKMSCKTKRVLQIKHINEKLNKSYNKLHFENYNTLLKKCVLKSKRRSST